MRMAVKPHQAFFLAARTDHAADLLAVPGRLPALLPSIVSPPPPSPHPGLGEGGGGETMLLRFPPRRAGPAALAQATPVGRRASRSGRQARTTVYPCGTSHGPRHLVPYTR